MRSAAYTSPKSIRSGLSSAGTSPKTTATPGSTSARTVDAVVESISESDAGSSATGEPHGYCSGRSPQARRSPSCPKGPACDLLPARARNGQTSSAFTAGVYGSGALRFSGNARPVAPRTSGFNRATTGRLMLASSTAHATAMPHSARNIEVRHSANKPPALAE